MATKIIGIDLAKTVFQLHGADDQGRATVRKRLSRSQLKEFIANHPRVIVAMEACSGANYWARVIAAYGHDARLIAPQFVKPYVRGNKTDGNDAAAICEAAGRPRMRFVAPKSESQMAMLMVHRVRERVVAERTALVNQIRGYLAEFGIVV